MSRLKINKEEILNNKSHMSSLDKFPTIYVNTDNVTDIIKSEESRHSQMNKSCILLALDHSSDFVQHFSSNSSFEIITPKQVQKRGKTFTTATLLEIARRARNEGKRVCVYKPFECLTLTDGGDRRLADVLWIFSLWMPVNTTFIYSVSELANLIHNNTKILYRFKSHGDIVRDMSRVREVSVRYGIEGTSRTYKDEKTGEIKKTDRRHSYNIKSVDLSSKSGDTVERLGTVMSAFVDSLSETTLSTAFKRLNDNFFLLSEDGWKSMFLENSVNFMIRNVDSKKLVKTLGWMKLGNKSLLRHMEEVRSILNVEATTFYTYLYLKSRDVVIKRMLISQNESFDPKTIITTHYLNKLGSRLITEVNPTRGYVNIF